MEVVTNEPTASYCYVALQLKSHLFDCNPPFFQV